MCTNMLQPTFRLFLLEELTLSEYFIGKQALAALMFPVLPIPTIPPRRLEEEAAQSFRFDMSLPMEGFYSLP